MVDIPLQFCIRENIKNNAVSSYKQCHEIWHQPDVYVQGRGFWQVPHSSGLKKDWYQRQLAQGKTYYIYSTTIAFSLFLVSTTLKSLKP